MDFLFFSFMFPKLPEAEKGIGQELIQEFLQLYQENYIKQDKLLPIRAEAREVSSYKLITKHLNDWGKDIGVRFELEEEGTKQEGDDTMHSVVIRAVKE